MRRTSLWCAGVACVALTLGAIPAPAQSTRPAATTAPAAVADIYKNVPLSPGRPAATQSAATATNTPSSDPLDTKRVAIALGIVLLAIYVAHRAWRKLGMPGSAAKGGQTLQVVSRLPISPRQQVLLIRVGRRFVLVANNGTQMNALCEIADPDEAAALLGQTVSETRESATATFNEVLDGAQQQFNIDAPHNKPSHADDAAEAAEDATLAATRDELGAMMDKVRALSKQFHQTHQAT